MARYYFHIKDAGADLIKDQEGTELSTPHAPASPGVRP